MSIEASAPSNIALIKYMGKLEGEGNRPTNSSFSWTLNGLRTMVRLSSVTGSKDQWSALAGAEFLPLSLSDKSQQRFLQHFAKLKSRLKIEGSFEIQSANNFPSDCGLASSASSFAALTMAAQKLAESQGQKPLETQELAELSRQGSGSSIRSFFEPWALWHSEGVRPLEFPIGHLQHQVVVVESEKKLVSSSEAHRRVTTSDLFQGRAVRAEKRLALLLQALRDANWFDAFELCWSEFWDMHALFETSQPSFGYFEAASVETLRLLRKKWQTENDGPLITMDAGANIHLLYRQDQNNLANEIKSELEKKWRVLS